MPHLQCALQISIRLHALEEQKGGLEGILCRLTIGVAILDATGKVILLNRAAEEIVAAADGLTIAAATSNETATLNPCLSMPPRPALALAVAQKAAYALDCAAAPRKPPSSAAFAGRGGVRQRSRTQHRTANRHSPPPLRFHADRSGDCCDDRSGP